MSEERNAIDPFVFKAAIADAKTGDRIVYYTGTTCARAPARLWARGASDAGLVMLVKQRLNSMGEDSVYKHLAIRTKAPYKNYVEAKDDEL